MNGGHGGGDSPSDAAAQADPAFGATRAALSRARVLGHRSVLARSEKIADSDGPVGEIATGAIEAGTRLSRFDK
jgi:hypothetical protein